jgi:branched-chain amino acid transport system substrate-binding protein
MNVKIGVLNDRSALYADLTGEGSAVAARMAAEDFKAKEKGINVTVVSADHQNKPDVGSNIARQWYDQDGVDAIADVPTSSVALAINQVTREKNKIFLNSGAATSDLTGKQCSPNTVHWTYDTYALAQGTGGAMVKAGGDTWFFLTADYAFGHALERDTTAIVQKNGGKVLGAVKTPFPGTDFSSFLLQAQASKAKVIGSPMRRRHDQLDQAGGRVRHHAGRPEARRAPGLRHGHPRARPADRAGSRADRVILLGQGRGHARLVGALRQGP